jgi:tetratricopeptide (TPR) repeat protein
MSSRPLVSVIVRSMGRPELRAALESIAGQDYPCVEAVVVDATGGNHPSLPDIAWQEGHSVRMVGSGRRLLRPHAANLGLESIRGEWLCFLDDDDTYDPHHVSTLVNMARSHPHALVVYGLSRWLASDGSVEKVFGLSFNRAIMYHNPLCCWQAALIRRKVRDLGCRFDEDLEVEEDQDFLAQIAEHGDFAFIPVVTFNYRPDIGTSGTGRGPNRDVARGIYYYNARRARWAGHAAYHAERATRQCRRGVAAYLAGDRALSRSLFEAALREYPDDPNALHGIGRLSLDQGALAEAEKAVRRAIEINPAATEFHLTLATILERAGIHAEAWEAAQKAARDPRLREMASTLLARLTAPISNTAAVPAVTDEKPSRLGLCSCGSGKRFKHCCGRIGQEPAHSVESGTDRSIRQAVMEFRKGEAFRAKARLDPLHPDQVTNRDLALAAGEVSLELDDCQQAYRFLRRAASMGDDAATGTLLQRCCGRLFKSRSDAALRDGILRLIGKFERRRLGGSRSSDAGYSQIPAGPIHVIGAFGRIGGSEHHAIRLFELLSGHAEARLWSTVPVIPNYSQRYEIALIREEIGEFPREGTLVFVGHYFDYGDWLSRANGVERVVICVNLDLPERLVSRLAQLEEAQNPFRVDFTIPSRAMRDHVGLPGFVEYPPVDVERFSRRGSASRRQGNLVIGQHSRDDKMKHHPNAPSLYRRLVAKGHRLRILGGTWLAPAFRGDPAAASIELLPEGSQDPRPFLEGLDCYVYGKHPHFFEAGGTAILEAMAMELPVIILFPDQVGTAELIENGRNGFVAESDEDALAYVDMLAADPDLRASIGAAARQTVVSLMQEQERAIVSFYLGKSV